MPWQLPSDLGLPANLPPSVATNEWKVLWAHEEDDLLAIAGAIQQGVLTHDVLDDDAYMELSCDQLITIRASHNAKKLGYVQALKRFNNDKYNELVSSGRALGQQQR